MTFDYDFLTRWLAALESGKYERGYFYLRHQEKFCCLGVACDVYDPKLWNSKWRFLGHQGDLPLDVMERLGFRTNRGGTNLDYSLSFKNDTGSTFSEIAALVRTRPDGLFTPEAEAVLEEKWGPKPT